MTQSEERRRVARQHGQGLAVLMNDQVHTVVDISVDGVAFQCRSLTVGEQIKIRVARLTDLEDGVDARATVREVTGSVVHAEFHGTLTLIRYVLGKLAA